MFSFSLALLLIKQAPSVFPVAELADTFQCFYVLFIDVRDVIFLVNKGCAINPVKKVFDEVGISASGQSSVISVRTENVYYTFQH